MQNDLLTIFKNLFFLVLNIIYILVAQYFFFTLGVVLMLTIIISYFTGKMNEQKQLKINIYKKDIDDLKKQTRYEALNMFDVQEDIQVLYEDAIESTGKGFDLSSLKKIIYLKYRDINNLYLYYMAEFVEAKILRSRFGVKYEDKRLWDEAIQDFLKNNPLVNSYTPSSKSIGRFTFYYFEGSNSFKGILDLIVNYENRMNLTLISNYLIQKFMGINTEKLVSLAKLNEDDLRIYNNENVRKVISKIISHCEIQKDSIISNPQVYTVIKDLMNSENSPYNSFKVDEVQVNQALLDYFDHKKIEYVDNLEGIVFEDYVKEMLEKFGYLVEATSASGDYGADLIVKYEKFKIAIQCKRWSGSIGVSAVQEVNAAKSYYKCNRAAVITNSSFTKNAYSLAKSTNVVLLDRVELLKLINMGNSLNEYFS